MRYFMTENEMYRNGNGMNHRAARDYGLTPPVAPEGGIPAAPGPGNGSNMPDFPIAPEGGMPSAPGDDSNIPSLPIAPGGGLPAFPGPDYPVPPIAPEGGIPAPPGYPSFPSFPIFPSYPSPQYFGRVRFLNASTNSSPVNISVDNTTYAVNSRFGTITNYDWISDGFHTITVRRATGLRSILLQQTFPFSAGEKVTMVLVDSGSGGLNMVRVSDKGCSNLPQNAGCYRLANMSYSGSSYDLMLYGGETVFRNVSFREVTPYKQAMSGSYQFYVTNSGNFTVVREIPVIVIGTYTNGSMVNEPLISFQADISAGKNYTTYLIGNTWSDNTFRALTVED